MFKKGDLCSNKLIDLRRFVSSLAQMTLLRSTEAASLDELDHFALRGILKDPKLSKRF